MGRPKHKPPTEESLKAEFIQEKKDKKYNDFKDFQDDFIKYLIDIIKELSNRG